MSRPTTDDPAGRRPAALRRLACSPAVHFAAGGLLLFAAVTLVRGTPPGAATGRERLVIPASRLELARRELATRLGRPPGPEAEEALVRHVVDEEVLYRHALELGLTGHPAAEQRLAQIAAFVADDPEAVRPRAELAAEALALGLHHGDQVTRRILVDAARRLIRAAVLAREPSEEALASWYREHAEELARPAGLRLSHVALAPDASEEDARRRLQHLRVEAVPPERAVAADAASAVPPHLPPLPERELARRFGHRFVAALARLPAGSWQGPVASRYGLHLVFLHERSEPAVPPFGQVREEVRARVRQELAGRWLELRLEELRSRYEVAVDGGDDGVVQTHPGRARPAATVPARPGTALPTGRAEPGSAVAGGGAG